MSLKLLIIGRGFLGSAVFSIASSLGISTITTNHKTLDITKIESIEKIVSNSKPDVVVNCAALTNVDQIETDPRMAYAVNAHGAKNVALTSLKNKIKLIHISTDSVFDGKKGMYVENDLPNPINEYTKSKKMGEDFVKEISDDFVIVRTNFYGYNTEGKYLFNWVLQNLQNKKPITAFGDIIFSPLEINNLAEMIVEIARGNVTGIIHLSSKEVISKYDFALEIGNFLKSDPSLIRKGTVMDASLIAKRPSNTSLSNLRAQKLLDTKPISLEFWLKNQFSKIC
jgi:dTDP-4-dehydrorhamnose reductase